MQKNAVKIVGKIINIYDYYKATNFFSHQINKQQCVGRKVRRYELLPERFSLEGMGGRECEKKRYHRIIITINNSRFVVISFPFTNGPSVLYTYIVHSNVYDMKCVPKYKLFPFACHHSTDTRNSIFWLCFFQWKNKKTNKQLMKT